MADASISISLTDKYSSKISDMASSSKSFQSQLSALSSEVATLEARQEAATKQVAAAKVAVQDAKTAFSDAQKAYKELNDEASKDALEQASLNLTTTTNDLKNFEKEATNAGNSIRTLATQAESMARSDFSSSIGITTTSSGISTSATSGVTSSLLSSADTFSSVLSAGIAEQAISVATDAVNTGVSSAFGSDTGSVISSALSGAISGAAIGSIIPGIGTAVGAAAGAAVGAISGGISVWSSQDDYYKDYYASAISTAQEGTASTVSTGSSTASSRETDLISFSTLLGSEDIATSYLADVKEMSNSTPFLYDDLTSISKTLLAYGTDVDDILGVVTNVGDAGSALGMSTDDINTMATALGRMTSTDKASLEYINTLTERGVSAIDWLAERDNISVADVYTNISDGAYSGKETAEFLSAKMEELYGGSMELQSQTYTGLTSTLEGWQSEIENAAGEGYNDTRGEGISSQIDFLSSSTGDALQEVYSIIGSNEAYMENLSEQYTREALDALLTGADTSLYGAEDVERLTQMNEEYLTALADYEETGSPDAALKVESLLQTAEIMGTMAYESSEQYKLVIQSEEDLVEATRTLASSFDAWTAQYALQQEYTKGQASTWGTDAEANANAGFTVSEDGVFGSYMMVNGVETFMPGMYADGLDTVPYDNFPALLHEGERVLTAREVRQGTGQSVSVNVTGNNFTVRTEADIEAIAKAIANQASLMEMAGKY